MCRLTPFGSFRRRHSADTDEETESGFNGVPSGFANIKSRVWTVLLAELLLPLAVYMEGMTGRQPPVILLLFAYRDCGMLHMFYQ